MTSDRVMAIVGAGHVGGRAAQTLREAGWRGGIALIGAERHLPYERPPLSKAVLTEAGEAAVLPLRSSDAWRLDAIDHVIATVQGLDTQAHLVRLHDGREIRYESLLIATGGHARGLSIPGADAPGVFRLRTLDDAFAIKPRLAPESRVVVIGGGFIGLEVAASARKLGCSVVVVEGGTRLLGRAVPPVIAAYAQALHERNGVRCVLGSAPSAIERCADGTLTIVFDGKEAIAADTVVVGIGIEPADELARAAGIEADRGIVVGETLETSARNVFAAGDVALFPSRFGTHRIRQETWHNAETQARVAARNMLGEQEPYRELPWFWSDQYDHQLQVAGEPALGRQAVARRLAGDAHIHFALDAAGRLVAASGFGPVSALAKEMRVARMLVDRAATVTPDQLSDTAIKLKGLL